MQNFGDAQLNNVGAFSAGPVQLVPGEIPGIHARMAQNGTDGPQANDVAFTSNPTPVADGSQRTTVDLSDRRTSTGGR